MLGGCRRDWVMGGHAGPGTGCSQGQLLILLDADLAE